MMAWTGAWSRPTKRHVSTSMVAIEQSLKMNMSEGSPALGKIIRIGYRYDPCFQLELAVPRQLKWKGDKGHQPNENRWRIKEMMQSNRIVAMGEGNYYTENGISDLLWDGKKSISRMLVMAWEKKCFRNEPILRYDNDGGKGLGCTRGKVNLHTHNKWGKLSRKTEALKARAATITRPAGRGVAKCHALGDSIRCWRGCLDPDRNHLMWRCPR